MDSYEFLKDQKDRIVAKQSAAAAPVPDDASVKAAEMRVRLDVYERIIKRFAEVVTDAMATGAAGQRERDAEICERLVTFTEDHNAVDDNGCTWCKALEDAAAEIRVTAPDSTAYRSAHVSEEQIVYNVAQRDPGFRKYLIEQLTAMGNEVDKGPLREFSYRESLLSELREKVEGLINETDRPDDLDRVIGKIFEIIPSYYDEREAEKIRRLLQEYFEQKAEHLRSFVG